MLAHRTAYPVYLTYPMYLASQMTKSKRRHPTMQRRRVAKRTRQQREVRGQLEGLEAAADREDEEVALREDIRLLAKYQQPFPT